LVNEVNLYYDAWSKKHQMIEWWLTVAPSAKYNSVQKVKYLHNKMLQANERYLLITPHIVIVYVCMIVRHTASGLNTASSPCFHM